MENEKRLGGWDDFPPLIEIYAIKRPLLYEDCELMDIDDYTQEELLDLVIIMYIPDKRDFSYEEKGFDFLEHIEASRNVFLGETCELLNIEAIAQRIRQRKIIAENILSLPEYQRTYFTGSADLQIDASLEYWQELEAISLEALRINQRLKQQPEETEILTDFMN